MVSGLLSTIGLVMCSLATNPLILLLGLLLTGFLLLQENILIGVIPEYFDRYYKTAVGVYSCGTGLGIVILPILTQYFLDVYGWRGALLLLSGLTFHSVPSGALLASQTANNPVHPLLKYVETISTKGKSISLQNIGRAIGLQLLTKVSFVLEVLVPGCVWGYTLTGWMIYMVSYAVSKGMSIREGSIVATSGGIGVVVVRIAIPLLHKVFTYRQLLYIASLVMAVSLFSMTSFGNFIALNIISLFYGIGIGTLGCELYISARVNADESEHYFAIAWLHVAYGTASLLSGFVTGIFFDVTGSFTLSFNILAVVSLLTTLSLALEDILEAMRSRQLLNT